MYTLYKFHFFNGISEINQLFDDILIMTSTCNSWTDHSVLPTPKYSEMSPPSVWYELKLIIHK